jgi:RHS repeat-associated protein
MRFVPYRVDRDAHQYPGRHRGEGRKHYNYFRDYDPAIGRYIESDPIGLVGGMNTFAYVTGDPIGLKDKSGLAPPPICFKGTDCPNPGFDPTPGGPKPSPQPPKPKPPGPNLKCHPLVKWLFGGCTCADTTFSYGMCLSCCSTVAGYLRSGGGACQVGCLDKYPQPMACSSSSSGSA